MQKLKAALYPFRKHLIALACICFVIGGSLFMLDIQEQNRMAAQEEAATEELQLLAQADLGGKKIHPALKLKPTDRILGDANAPVTIVEYSSMTCSHCANFHNDILPEIEKKYIATGKVKFVMRDLPWDNFALGMAAVARCAPEQYYYPLVKAMYRSYDDLVKSADPLQSIQQLAMTAGLQPSQVAMCIRDENLQKQILDVKDEALKALKVRGTPTLFINGERLHSAHILRAVEEAIELALQQSAKQA